MKTQLLRGRNARMQKCRSVFCFCTFALLHFCFTSSIFAQSFGEIRTFIDSRDGKEYKKVYMPDLKWWMAENLRYTKGLNNPVFGYKPVATAQSSPGTNLKGIYYCPGPGPLNSSPNTATTSQADPLACEYWGCLYPWWTANSTNGNGTLQTTLAQQGICPPGWHLPSDQEWALLLNVADRVGTGLPTTASNNRQAASGFYSTAAGTALKSTDRGSFSNNQAYTPLWRENTYTNKDILNFRVLAAGIRNSTGTYGGNGANAYFWTSSGNSNGGAAANVAYSRRFDQNNNSANDDKVYFNTNQSASDALSVRCVEGTQCEEGLRAGFIVSKYGSQKVDTSSLGGMYLGRFIRESYDTIEFIPSRGTAFTYIHILQPSSIGNWAYSITPVASTIPSGVTVDIQKGPLPPVWISPDTIVEFLFKGLTSTCVDKTIQFKIVASNPVNCNTDQDLFLTFRAWSGQTMTDPRDGRIYKTTILPDGKEWMAENLYFKGCTQAGYTCSALSFLSMSNAFSGTGAGQGNLSYFCLGENSKTGPATQNDCEKYGALYTFDCAMWLDGNKANGAISCTPTSGLAVATNNCQIGGRGICPPGWHIPTDNEWGIMLNAVETTNGNTLSNTFNVSPDGPAEMGIQNHNIGQTLETQRWQGIDAGSRLQYSGAIDWRPTWPKSTDQYNFRVLPSGRRDYRGLYYSERRACGYFWSSSATYSTYNAFMRGFVIHYPSVYRAGFNRAEGISVRCVKN